MDQHLTRDNIGGNSGTIGERIPGVFFHPNDGLVMFFAINNHHNFQYDVSAPPIGEWTKIQKSQELVNQQFKFRISIDETEKFNAENSKAVGFKNMKVFAADPWYKAQPGFVKNLSIKQCEGE